MMMVLACSFCAQQTGSDGATFIILGLLAVPFALAAVALRAIRHLDG
jgi:hypothetical protein